MPYHLGHTRRPIQPYMGRALTGGAIQLTDTPAGVRHAGPDGSVLADVLITGDTPAGIRLGGPDGSIGVSVTDTPSAVRCGGPDGVLLIGIVLTDTPSGFRGGGPEGILSPDLEVTDTPGGIQAGGPDGFSAVEVVTGPDTPGAARAGGPDGTPQVDLTVTDVPNCVRLAGPEGTTALGIGLTDTSGGYRAAGPAGDVVTDLPGALTVTGDTPSGIRGEGPDGVLALGLTLTGESPSGVRGSGPDGATGIDVLFTDTPSAIRAGGGDGVLDITAGGTDTPGGARAMGPDGVMGIVYPLTGDTPSGGRCAGPTGVLVVGIGADVVITPTGPTAVRCSGPDGQVLLAFLPTRIPYVTPGPLTIPRYALWVADTRTGRMLWELPMGSCSWSSTLGAVGTIRATLEVEKTWDTLTDQDERDPRILLREVLTGPWRFSLVVMWGNNVVWAGPYTSLHRPGPSSVELSGAEIGKLLTKRVLIHPGAVSATDPGADTTIGPGTTKPHAAAVLLNQLITGAGNNLPILVTDPAGSGIDARIYYGYDLRTYWDALSALSGEVDGPEIRFDPQVTQGPDGFYLSWVTQIGNPHVGRTGTVWVFDSGVTSIVGFDADASTQAFGVWSGGSGTSRDKLITHSTDTAPLNIGWPMLEEVDTAHSSETVYPVLAAQTASVLAAQKQPVIAFQVQVPADADPMVGTYRAGEDFQIDVRDDPLIPDGVYSRRIAGLSGSEKPWVTITDANPLPAGSL